MSAYNKVRFPIAMFFAVTIPVFVLFTIPPWLLVFVAVVGAFAIMMTYTGRQAWSAHRRRTMQHRTLAR